MIITGAGAGLAAAFNTPLGGIVFSIEELSKSHISRYRTQLFTAIIIAGLTAQYLLGTYLYIGYPEAGSDNFFVFVLLLLVSFLCALLSNLVSSIILSVLSWKKRLSPFASTYILPVVLGLLFATLVYLFGSVVMGSGKEIINESIFSPNYEVHWYTPLLRSLGPILSFSTEAATGIFAPSLSAGASVGAVVADLFQIYHKEANVLILGGMAAFLTGITRSPFTSAILVFEMTNSHDLIFYLLFAAMIANVISYAINQHSFYELIKKRILVELDSDTVK
jgi:H+/Cl- antiporter ClcA